MESVFKIAESGNGYLAVERSSFVLRKLKKENKIDEAMIFMMDLAHKLADVNQWPAATVSALRSIEMFPPDAKTIRVVLKKSFINFIERATVDAATTEFYTYVNKVSNIIGDKDHLFFKKKFEIAIAAHQPDNAHSFAFIELLREVTSEEPEIDIDNTIKKVIISQWEWVTSLPEDDKEFTGQYIMARFLISILSLPARGIELTQKYYQIMKETLPETLSASFFEQPLFHFIEFLVDACIRQNPEAIAQLEQSYKPLLEKDTEFTKWIACCKSIHCPAPQNNAGAPNFGNLFQNVFRMFQPPQQN